MFRRADELSTTTRGFYLWLVNFLTEAKTKQFTALDIRKSKAIHPRTLNRYLQELSLYSYVQVAGGNKNREGYRYKLTEFGNQTDMQNRIEQELKTTLEKINATQNTEHGTEPQTEPTEPQPTEPTEEPKPETTSKRVRIVEKEEHTLKTLLELEAQQAEREYLPEDFTTITKRSYTTEARYLKTLWEQGKLSREWKNRQYYYRLATDSKTVGQTPLTNSEALAV